MSNRTAPPPRKKKETASRSGGIDLDASEINISGDVVGRDKIQTQQYIERQTNFNLPRGVQIALGVAATAIVVIAFSLLLAPKPALANGDFGSGNLEGWDVMGAVTVVESDASDDYYAVLPTGSSIGQSVLIPEKNPVLSISYRSNVNVPSRGTIDILVNEIVYKHIEDLLNATEWRTNTYDMKPYAGQVVKIRIEYVEQSTHSAGVLTAPALQTFDAVSIDHVEVSSLSDEAIAQITSEPSNTSTALPTLGASSTSTSVRPTESPRPTSTRTALRTSGPTATNTKTSTPVPTQLSIVTSSLTFTWQQGNFRDAGKNQSGQGIWAREITISPSGGQSPYSIAFTAGNASPGSLTFEVFGLFCEGQIGTLTVTSADGQSASKQITIVAPICPTNTPTPTATFTSTSTNTLTPTFTIPPIPQPSLINGGFEDPAIPGQSKSNLSSIPGWTLSFGPSIEIDNNWPFYGMIPVQGAQLVELDSDNPSGIYQDIATVPGVKYRVTFAFAARPGTVASDNVLEFAWDNNSIDVLTHDGTGLGSPAWKYYSYDVTATSNTSRLEFRDLGTPSTQGTLLDDVSIELAP